MKYNHGARRVQLTVEKKNSPIIQQILTVNNSSSSQPNSLNKKKRFLAAMCCSRMRMKYRRRSAGREAVCSLNCAQKTAQFSSGWRKFQESVSKKGFCVSALTDELLRSVKTRAHGLTTCQRTRHFWYRFHNKVWWRRSEGGRSEGKSSTFVP